jgi:5-methylcytosine-specific restriction endonuclease McrA|uniref:HNH endonuclease n=1 Tax=candidate division WOR-3 bacterium TaxID=2052148 RepID=A0A7V3NUZ1_UNCW3
MGLFHTLSKEKKMEILGRILEFQNGKCFLCEEEIEKSALNDVEEFLRKHEVDHKIALSEGGKDDWVILHRECNRKNLVKS